MLFKTSTTRRGGFTLLEVMIVIVIMLMIMGLTLGAVFKGLGFVRRSNTEQTMQKVHERLGKRQQAIADEVSKIEPNATLMALAGGDRARARVLLQKFITKWSFPMSFDEIVVNVAQSQAFYGAEGYPAATFFNQQRKGMTGDLELTNSACLAMIYERLGGIDDLSGSERSVVQIPPPPATVPPAVLFSVILDSWGQPMRYYRCPVEHNDLVTGNNKVEQSYPPEKRGIDPDDPQGLLNLMRQPENYDTSGTTADWYNIDFGGTPCGQWVHDNLQHFRTPVPRAPVFCPMTIVSHGPDSGGPQRQWGFTANNYYMQVNAAQADREADNLYSYRSRLGLSGQ